MEILKLLKKHRKFLLIFVDLIIIVFSYYLTTVFVLDNTFAYKWMFLNSIAISLCVYPIMFIIFNVYINLVKFASAKEYIMVGVASFLASLIVTGLGTLLSSGVAPLKVNVLACVFVSVFCVAYRVVIRAVYNLISFSDTTKPNKKNVLVIGAGYAAADIVKYTHANMKKTYNLVGIIDDDKDKRYFSISGVRILGGREEIVRVCKQKSVDLILFAISNIDRKDKHQILKLCEKTNAKVRVLPSTEQIIRNRRLFENFRDIEIDDLLGREPIKLNNKEITSHIRGKVVLVTGAGGSIGSELCRQIIKYKPQRLVILDIYENTLYELETELKRAYKNIDIPTIIASVREKERLEEIFDTYRPNLVFHAAAHKHVPLMETSPKEAIKNNVFGTLNVAECSDKYKVEKFILISTDKAVNPTSIMGATKRICEMIIQAKNRTSKTDFAAVRFGNVLGSNGSVIPLFKKQITEGGPVTVTHKEITRFFMTIPEAVGLILQCASFASGGEIFVLDMGEPVKIYDLAETLIRLSGYEPNVDMQIKVTGLRPGEKLYEELIVSEEGLSKTVNKKIFVSTINDFTKKDIEEKLKLLEETIEDKELDNKEIRKIMKQIVPTFIDNKSAEETDEQEKIIEFAKYKDKMTAN